MKKLILTLMLISSTVSANWLYDTVNAIDDAGIAVSGVIVDGVNGVAYGATSLWEHTIGLCAIHTCVWDPSAEPPEVWSRNKDEKTK
jgi:hypothetical protein